MDKENKKSYFLNMVLINYCFYRYCEYISILANLAEGKWLREGSKYC